MERGGNRTESSSGEVQDGSSGDYLFPAASQPDIVRASQKDDFYKKFLTDELFDLVNRLFGN
jgi:hypothetical protein